MSDYAYKKEHYRQVLIRFSKQYYSDVLSPAVESSGEDCTTYIKKAIEMRMEADGFKPPEKA